MAPRRVCILFVVTLACALAGCGSSASHTSSASTAAVAPAPTGSTSTPAPTSTAPANQPGPEGIPLEAGPALGPASSTTPGATVDGVKCAPVEQLAYHIHSHLQVYAGGQPLTLPGAIGLLGPVAQQTPYGSFYGARQCYYWLHTHTSDGVIHIESPSARVYTLGDFFDEWRQPLSPSQVASARGKVTAFLNGKAWNKDPRAIPLLPHASIQLDVGTPAVAPQVISWDGTNL